MDAEEDEFNDAAMLPGVEESACFGFISSEPNVGTNTAPGTGTTPDGAAGGNPIISKGPRGGGRSYVLTSEGRAGYRRLVDIEDCSMCGYIMVAEYVAARDLFKCVSELGDMTKVYKNEQKVMHKGDAVTIIYSPVYKKYADAHEPSGVEVQFPRPLKRYRKKREKKKENVVGTACGEAGGGAAVTGCGGGVLVSVCGCGVVVSGKEEDGKEEGGNKEESAKKKDEEGEGGGMSRMEIKTGEVKDGRGNNEVENSKKKEEVGGMKEEGKEGEEKRDKNDELADKKEEEEGGGEANTATTTTTPSGDGEQTQSPIKRRNRHINIPRKFGDETHVMSIARKNELEEASVWFTVQDAKGRRTLWRRRADLILTFTSYQRTRCIFVEFTKKGVTTERARTGHKDIGPLRECYQVELIPGCTLWIDKLLCLNVRDRESYGVEDLISEDFGEYGSEEDVPEW